MSGVIILIGVYNKFLDVPPTVPGNCEPVCSVNSFVIVLLTVSGFVTWENPVDTEVADAINARVVLSIFPPTRR